MEEITLRRWDLPITIGLDTDEAVEFAMSLGPAGGNLRLAADHAAHLGEPAPTRYARASPTGPYPAFS